MSPALVAGFGALPLPPFGRKKGPVGLDDLDDDEEEVEAMLAAMMGRQMGKGGKQKPARLPPTSIPIRPAPTGRGGGSAIDRSAPLDQQWVAAAKAGAVDALKRCYEADNSLLTKPARGIGHTALHWSAAAGLTLPASRSAYPAVPFALSLSSGPSASLSIASSIPHSLLCQLSVLSFIKISTFPPTCLLPIHPSSPAPALYFPPCFLHCDGCPLPQASYPL